MLIPLKPGELQRLIPAVGTSTQFAACLGDPRKILQRLMIAAIGGVISFLIYNQAQLGSRWGPFWLLLSVVFFLYVLWGPILEAGRRNATLRRFLLQRCLRRSGRCLHSGTGRKSPGASQQGGDWSWWKTAALARARVGG